MTGPAFLIPSQVFHREVDGQMVLLNLDTEQYYGLDAVGANIITRLTDRPWDAAIAALLDDYEVDPAELVSDIEELIGTLVEVGLLERNGRGG